MAILATNVPPSSAYVEIKKLATDIKVYADSVLLQLQETTILASKFLSIIRQKQSSRKMEELALTPGLDAYAQEQEDDLTYVLTTEIQATVAALDAVVGYIGTNYPTDIDGHLLDRTVIDFEIVYDTYPTTAPIIQGVIPLLQAVTDSIV